MSTASEPPAKAGRREWLGLLVLALPALLISVDLTVLFLALPHLAADLQPTGTQQLWILDIYGFMIAGLLVTMGTVGDRLGRRKLLLIGGAAFGIASLVAAFSTTPEMLIVARALLGIAGATLAPSTLALIINMFQDPKQRTAAIGVWTSCYVVGALIGPIIGGVMLTAFWWGSVFLMAVPVMVLLLVAGPVLLPEYRNPQAGKLDLPSAVLALVTIIPVIFGLKELARAGWATFPVVALVVGIGFGVVFVRRQHRLEDPLLDLDLFKIRLYRNDLVLGLLIGIICGGAFLLVNLYLQLVVGLSTWETGLWLIPSAAASIVGIQVGTRMSKTIRPAYLMAAGLVLAVVGFVLLSQLSSTGSLALVVAGAVLVNAGVGPYVALGYGILVNAAPPEKAGSASALSQTSGEFGVAGGIAFLGSVGTLIYRDQLTVPEGVPAEAADSARESIANAVSVAGDLPGQTAGQLVTSAQESFTTGLNVVGWVAAVIFVGFIALSLKWFRQLPPTSEAALGAEAPAEEAEKKGAPEPDPV